MSGEERGLYGARAKGENAAKGKDSFVRAQNAKMNEEMQMIGRLNNMLSRFTVPDGSCQLTKRYQLCSTDQINFGHFNVQYSDRHSLVSDLRDVW